MYRRYRIITHLLLIYCVIGVTYLLFFNQCGECGTNNAITSNESELELDTTGIPSTSPTTSLSGSYNTTILFEQMQHIQISLFEVDDISYSYCIQHGRWDASRIVDPMEWEDSSEHPSSIVAVIEVVGAL